MKYEEIQMPIRKRIALVAHDNKKEELFEWYGGIVRCFQSTFFMPLVQQENI
jgi:methylglyoxal synthase